MKTFLTRTLTALVATQSLVACVTDADPDPTPPQPEFDAGPRPSPVPGLDFEVLDLRTNGGVAAVMPGEDLAVELFFDADVTDCDGCRVQVAVAFEGATECIMDAASGRRGTAHFSAPEQAGHFPIRVAATLDEDCAAAEAAALRASMAGEVTVEDSPAPPPPPPPPPANESPVLMGLDVGSPNFANACTTTLVAEARDPEGQALRYRWQMAGEQARADGASLVVPGGPARARTASLTITDAEGAETSTEIAVDLRACELPAGAIANAAGDRAYLVDRTERTYDEHRLAAAAMGGHLATLTSQAEIEFVRTFDGEGWIGLWSPNRDHVFQTITGEPTGGTFFCPGEPNNAGGAEYGVELWDIVCFNDEAFGRQRVAVYEFELPGIPEDVSAGGAFERPGFDRQGADRTILRLAEAGTVQIRVTDGRGGCDGVGDPMLFLLHAGEQVMANDDSNGLCPAITADLPAGVYDLNVRGFTGSAVSDHRLEVTLGR